MWYVKHFMTSSASDSLKSRLYLENKKTSNKPESIPYSRKEVINHLLETHAADDVIAENETEMENFKINSNMTLNMTPIQYAESLWMKTLS